MQVLRDFDVMKILVIARRLARRIVVSNISKTRALLEAGEMREENGPPGTTKELEEPWREAS